MLRQALVDAEKSQAALPTTSAESTPLSGNKQQNAQQQQQVPSYGATATTTTTHQRKRSNTSSPPGAALASAEEAEEGTASTVARKPQSSSSLGAAVESGGDVLSSNMYSEDDEDDEEYLSEDEDDDEEDDDDDETLEEPELNVPQKVWNGIKAFVRIVANVDNLWDTPPNSPQPGGSDPRRHRRRNKFVVLFWFVVLASSYAGERSTFKLLVDRAGPFRLVSVQLVTFSHAFMLGIGLLVSHYVRLRQANPDPSMPLGVPLVDIGLMALLDTVTLLMVFITAFHVSPTLTVLLVQFIIPLTAFLSQFMHPDGRWTCCRPDESSSDAERTGRNASAEDSRDPLAPRSGARTNGDLYDTAAVPVPAPMQDAPLRGWGGLTMTHIWGSLILFLAVAMALFPAFYSIANPAFFIYADPIPIRTAINTMTYVSSCIPAAASQLYKEHILLQYKQPVNVDKMNFLLSIFIFIFASIVSPLAYSLQGLGTLSAKNGWTSLYPSGGFSDNFVDGLQCFFGTLSEDDQENKYPEDAECSFTLTLILSHAFCIIAIGVGVDKIVNSGATKVMYRGISAGIILATLCMHFYEIQSSDFFYGPVIETLNLVCLALMVLGAEVYHRTTLQESTFETVYQPVEVPTFEDY